MPSRDELVDARREGLANAGNAGQPPLTDDHVDVAFELADRTRGVLIGACLKGVRASQLQQAADLIQNARDLSLIHGLPSLSELPVSRGELREKRQVASVASLGVCGGGGSGAERSYTGASLAESSNGCMPFSFLASHFLQSKCTAIHATSSFSPKMASQVSRSGRSSASRICRPPIAQRRSPARAATSSQRYMKAL